MLVLTRYAPRVGDSKKRDRITVILENGDKIDIYLVESKGRQCRIGVDCDNKYEIVREDIEFTDEESKKYDSKLKATKSAASKVYFSSDTAKKNRKRMAGLIGGNR